MSRIKELKNDSSNNINLIELVSLLVAQDKTKYIEMFMKIFKNCVNDRISEKTHIINDFLKRFEKVDGTEFKELSYLEVSLLSIIVNVVDPDNVEMFNKFCEYNERNLIEKNDISQYNSFQDMINEVNKVDFKLINKELEKQVITLFNDDEWMVIKPLSYESSKKYGSNTKWCTTSTQNPEYFFRYFRKGILVYCINKKTGYKVAAHRNLTENEVTFWNQKDSRIDSFDTELPGEIIQLLRKEIKFSNKSNYSLADPDEIKREMEMYHMGYTGIPEPEPVPRRIGRFTITNRYDEQPNPEQEGIDEDMGIGEQHNPEQEGIGEEMGIPGIRVQGMEIADIGNVVERNHDIVTDRPTEDVADFFDIAYEKSSGKYLIDVNDINEVPIVPRHQVYHGVDAEMEMANQIHEAMRENEAEWPENHGINVRG